MEFSDTKDEAAFRVEIRTWIDGNAPDYLFEPLSTSGFGSIQIDGFDPLLRPSNGKRRKQTQGGPAFSGQKITGGEAPALSRV